VNRNSAEDGICGNSLTEVFTSGNAFKEDLSETQPVEVRHYKESINSYSHH